MHEVDFSKRQFLKYALAGGAAVAGNNPTLSLISDAYAAPGKPIPPIVMTYYANWPEIVEFFRKAAQDLRKLGLTPKLNPQPSEVAVPKTLQQHDYGDWGSIMWGATPDRLDPNFQLEELLFSKSQRNYGYYNSAKYDAACEAQRSAMDREKRRELVWNAQAVAAADYPVWWLAHPVVISAYNQKYFDGAAEIMGAGYGHVYSSWNYMNIFPKTSRKTLRSAIQREYNTLNPFSASTSPNQTFVRFFYDTFALIGPDLKVRPWAAESWNLVNPTTVDLVLRQGMKFHDGAPVTGEDVAFTFDYLKKWDFPFFRSAMSVIDRVEVKGNNIRLRLTKPYAPFFSNVLTWLFIIPKHIWKDIPEKVGVKHPGDYANPNPVGSGPFLFGHWRKGQEFYFKANKSHLAAPKVDDFYFSIIPGIDGVAGALERGEIDLTQETLTPALADQLMQNPDMKVGYAPSHGVYEVRPDLKKAPFSDVNFRRAIYHAFDRRPIINFFAGKARVSGNTPITPLNEFWHNPKLPAPEYNLDRARETLKAAGYSWDASGSLLMPVA